HGDQEAEIGSSRLLQQELVVGQLLDLRVEAVDSPVTLGQRPDRLAVAIQERIGRPGQVLSNHVEQFDDLGVDSPKFAIKLLSFLASLLVLSHGQSLQSPASRPPGGEPGQSPSSPGPDGGCGWL